MSLFGRASPCRCARHVRFFCESGRQPGTLADMWQRYGEHAKQLYWAYKIVMLPVTVFGGAFGLAKFYKSWNPDAYARCYLRWISAGRFREPLHKQPWVQNKGLTAIVRGALSAQPNEEGMTLVSGLQMCGKTSAIMMECCVQKRQGFFVTLAKYRSKKDYGEPEIEAYIVNALVANEEVHHNFFQLAAKFFFPVPEPAQVLRGLEKTFKAGGLVLVVDEVQMMANPDVLANGIMNTFCSMSSSGPVVLVASEYNVPQFLKRMTHVASRTLVVYAPTATPEEMLPYARERFGDKSAQRIVDTFDGAFSLLRKLKVTGDVDVGIREVQEAHKKQVVYNLELTEDGMKTGDRATRTGEAMVAAARLAFGDKPLDPFNKGTLELAQAGAAKIESVGLSERAAWAAPVTEVVMKDVLCDGAIHAIMKERLDGGLYKKFEQAIQGRCPPAAK